MTYSVEVVNLSRVLPIHKAIKELNCEVAFNVIRFVRIISRVVPAINLYTKRLVVWGCSSITIINLLVGGEKSLFEINSRSESKSCLMLQFSFCWFIYILFWFVYFDYIFLLLFNFLYLFVFRTCCRELGAQK